MKSTRVFEVALLASLALPAALVACGAPQSPPPPAPGAGAPAASSPTAAVGVTTSASVATASPPSADAGAAAADTLVVVDEVVGQGPAAKSGDAVSVDYTGTLTDGTVFDSSKKHGAFDFQLGEGRVIKGWDQGVAGMKVGGTRKLTVPPSLAYGGRSVGPIPPNSTLVFEVELLAITPGEGPSGAASGPKHNDRPTHISARHVLIQWMGCQTASSSVVRTQEQALKVAQDVLRQAKGGADFARLAVEYSDEPNAGHRGGSVGNFGHGQMVKQFEDAAFALAPGEISGIVESPFGYHIIQRTE